MQNFYDFSTHKTFTLDGHVRACGISSSRCVTVERVDGIKKENKNRSVAVGVMADRHPRNYR